jgi:hypothetical protein
MIPNTRMASFNDISLASLQLAAHNTSLARIHACYHCAMMLLRAFHAATYTHTFPTSTIGHAIVVCPFLLVLFWFCYGRGFHINEANNNI